MRINVTKDTTLDSTTTTPACTPRRKPKKQKASTSDDEEAAEPETTSTSNLTDVNRKKRWTAEDMAKLKVFFERLGMNPFITISIFSWHLKLLSIQHLTNIGNSSAGIEKNHLFYEYNKIV